MCTVRSGSHVPMLVSGGRGDLVGVVVLDDQHRRAPHDIGERPGPPGRHRHAGGILSPRLEDQRGGRIGVEHGVQLGNVDALVVDVDAHDVAAQALEEIEHRREARMLDHDAVAEVQHDAGHAVESVQRPVDDRDRLGRKRPRRSQLVLQGWQHGVVEVARRQRLAADFGDDRREVRQQVRVRRPGGQVEGEVARTLADLAISARTAGAGRMAHERPVATASLDRSDVGEAPPGLRDGCRRDAQPAREFADRRQTFAHFERSGGDHSADGRGDRAEPFGQSTDRPHPCRSASRRRPRR